MQVCISPCPNDTFAFGHLIQGNVDWSGPPLSFRYEDIQTLNQLGLSDNPPDVLKFSYGLWPKLMGSYRLLKTGSALGHGVGPLIVGRGSTKLEEREALLIPGIDTTAALLARRYFPNALLEVLSYEEILPALENDPNKAGVIIHESRFTYQDHRLQLLFDLGAHWEKETRSPLPLGGVAILKKHGEGLACQLEGSLKASVDMGWKNPEALTEFMQIHAQEMKPEVMEQHVQLYVNEDTRDLSDQGIRAIETLCNIGSDELWS
jgi:1,4-dihydroxy-6-naphthoate synthase